MEENFKLFDAEYRFACIVWEYEPISSGELTKICQERLGWKRTTTYTVLKKLCTRSIMKNEKSIVTALVKREQIQQLESKQFLDKIFNNSLPSFITCFMGDKKISAQEAEQLKKLIDSYKEE